MSWVWAGGAGLVAIGLLGYGAFHPQSSLLTPVIHRGPRDGPARVAVTFDDGPHPEATPAILDVLARLGAPATFFAIGLHVQGHPDVVRRIDAEGHLVGNHTFHHSWHGLWRGVGYWRREMRATADIIEQTIGKRPALFRPPMGFKQRLMGWAASREGCRVVTWSRRGRDGWRTTPGQILERLVEPAKPGDILTLHDGNDPHLERDPTPTVEVVAPLIEGLRRRGIEVVRLDELIGLPGYQSLRNG